MLPRYLTPSKLTLLLLTDLYIFSDQIATTSKLNVLSFIASQINPPLDYDDNNNNENEPNIHFATSSSADITDFSEKLSQCPSTIPGRNIYDIVLQRVWELEGLDSLFALFQHLTALVAPAPAPQDGEVAPPVPKISRASPLGQYVRRCCVEFTRLQFSDAKALWEGFAAYRAASYEVWAERNPREAERRRRHVEEGDEPAWATSSSTSHHPNEAGGTNSTTSATDTTTLLTHSLSRLQTLGTRLPSSLKPALQTFFLSLTSSSSSSESLPHFLLFFDHWRSGQYTSALESLHRYFDYSLISQSQDGEGGMRGLYQYALLHLSVLHADFGHWGEAGESLEECIATARENNDPQCLNFALSSLLYLRQTHPTTSTSSPFANLSNLLGGGEGNDEIAFLKAKAREGRNWSLLSSTLLEEARGEMGGGASSGDGGGVGRAMERILQAEYLNVQHDLRTLMPAAKMFHGSGFERLGQSTLSTHTYESIPIVHSINYLPVNDRVRANCRVAYSLAQSGRYDQAILMLEAVGKGQGVKGVLKVEQRVMGFGMLVLGKRAVHENDLEAATHHLHELQPLRDSGDPGIGFEIFLLKIDVLLKQQRYQEALSTVNAQVTEIKGNPGSDIAHHLHLLLLKCTIFATGGQAIKGFSIALRAAVVAERLLLVSVLVEAVRVLSLILTELSEFEAAREMIEGVLPFVLEGRDGYVTARLFSQLAEAYVGLAGTFELDSTEQVRHLRGAEGYVERGYEAFAKLSDLSGMLDCLSMKARLARWKGDEASAKQADERWLQLLGDSPAERKRMEG